MNPNAFWGSWGMILGCFKFSYVLTIKHSGPIHRCDDGHMFRRFARPMDSKTCQKQSKMSRILGIDLKVLVKSPIFDGWTMLNPSILDFSPSLGWPGAPCHWAPGREIPSCRRPLPASLPGRGVIAWWRWCRPLPGDGHGWRQFPHFQWIGLRENLQESPIFNGKIYGFL
jgi:hypothetical protein